ncbi:alpha/beta fold hydrolase [Mycobacterium sp. pUA109]|uniref:alpha/beta fold hydrolase n=1 Tax=Mycobacterium sp. pUA109 TaxID=3238982 RepID=UPI00351B157B
MTRAYRDARWRQVVLPLDDAWLNVTEWGTADADLTVVLTHGWTLSARIWEDVAASLVTADPGVRVLAYDHRGHGRSARVSTASIEQLADDLADVVAQLVPAGPIVFGGHSLGGMVLVALAQRHPRIVAQRAAGVMFVATSAGDLMGAIRKVPGTETLMTAALRGTARMALPSRPLFLARQGARGAFGKHPRRHDLNRVVRQGEQADPAAVAALGRSILDHRRYPALRAYRHLNVVAMAGTRDWLTPPIHARRIAEQLPDSELVVFDGAGHFLPYERREAVSAHLLNLIAKARQSAQSRSGVAG